MKRRLADRLVTERAVGFVLGVAGSVATTLIIDAAFGHDLTPVLFALTIILLAVSFQSVWGVTKWLILSNQTEPATIDDARESVMRDLVRSLISYRMIGTQDQRKEIEDLGRSFTYIRGQNFLTHLRNEFNTEGAEIRILNDHPLAPFSEQARTGVNRSNSMRIINAEPDELYGPHTLKERLVLARDPKVEYWLLPAAEIHLSMIIFEGRLALIYATPAGRTACDFSEALVTENPQLIELLSKTHEVVLGLARQRLKARGTDAVTLLSSRLRTIESGAESVPSV